MIPADAWLDYLLSNPHRDDEVLASLPSTITNAQLQRLARDYNLEVLNSTQMALTGRRVQRFRITDGSTVRQVLQTMRQDPRISASQPNMLYRKSVAPATRPISDPPTQRGPRAVPGPARPGVPKRDPANSGPSDVSPNSGGSTTRGTRRAPDAATGTRRRSSPSGNDELQYALKSIRAPISADTGPGRKPVLVAIVDSGIHETHTALRGAIADRTSVIGDRESGSRAHGTAIAGIIAGQDTVRGVARSARLLDVQTFYKTGANGRLETSSFMLARGIDWAYGKGARIYNLSFAGPSDPALEEVFKAGAKRGLIFVAAAGNAGPKAPPAYPAAYPEVIAITATDVRDSLYKDANRGQYLNVAAPGVDIFVATDDGTFGFRSGTSMAAAHASGLAALVLMKDGRYTPDDFQTLLEQTAEDLGPKGRDVLYGAGRINAERALAAIKGGR